LPRPRPRALLLRPSGARRESVVHALDGEEICADPAAVLQAALEFVDEQDRRPFVECRERDRLPDRPGAEDDDTVVRRHATARDRADGDRHRLDQRRERGAHVAHREHLRARKQEPILEPAVAVDCRSG